MLRCGLLAAVVLVIGCLVPATLQAGPDPDYVLSMSNETGFIDDTATVSLSLDNTGSALQGWSWGVCDDGLVSITEADVTNGAAVDSVTYSFHAISDLTGGWTVGCLTNVVTSETLAPGENLEMYLATYALEGVGTSTVEYCALGSPQVLVTVIVAATEVEPVTEDGTIEILEVPPVFTLLTAEDAQLTVNLAGQTLEEATVIVTLTNDDSDLDVGAFSFGLEHDPAKLDLLDITLEDTVTEEVNGGDGPEYVARNLSPEGGTGGTLAILVSLENEPFDTISPGEDQPIANFIYGAGTSVGGGDSTTVQFTGDLGSPPVSLVVSVAGKTWEPFLVNGTITVVETDVVTHSFLRGDVNSDGIVAISDAIALLSFMFPSASSSFSPDCEASGDINDDGIFTLAEDAIRLLNYLFNSGTAPAAPFPDCGLAEEAICDEDTSSCE